MVVPDAGALREVTCIDQSISTLMLFDNVTAGLITDESVNAPTEFVHHIDATAGGMTARESYVYARFEDTGLTKVSIDDEAAFESGDWDIAFRRFIIRLNSGVAGPSVVTGARTAPGTTFEALTAVPEGLTYREEAYFTDSCDYVPDGTDLASPQTALFTFWTYSGCVQMSHYVYVVALANGRHVKLEVVSYYTPEVQTLCNDSDTITMPSGAGNLRIRWAFLD